MHVTVSGVEERFRYSIFPDPTLRIALDEPSEQILRVTDLVDNMALASFLGDCQFKYGGIAKASGEHPGGVTISSRLECTLKTPF